jgi:radical SAM superfamily enzyme YgiQ (UPF0313 family)
MKITLVNVEDSIISIGFRKMAAHVKSYHADTSSYYVTPGRRNLREHLAPRENRESDQECKEIAEGLATADLVGFSSMSIHAENVAGIISHLRRKNPKTFVVWGGCHAILDPDSAIQHADAVCTGEGELAFSQLLDAYANGRDYYGTRNFWFRKGADVVKNGFLPLLSSEELGRFPPPEYASGDEMIFSQGSGFAPLTKSDYLKYNGLSYRTVWSIGCPFHCTFCGNTKFIANDKAYTKIRHSPVPSLMRELQGVKEKHPHVRSVIFDDDSFMALRMDLIQEFAREYKEKIGLLFTVTGVIPNYVKREKLEILTQAGLIRLRVGLQSGSRRILDFYKRPIPPEKVLNAARIVNSFRRSMIPPAYDIIMDNPIETADDIRETLQLVYDLPRPFTLNIFSLNVMPNTNLAGQFAALGIDHGDVNRNFKRLVPTLANAILYLLCVMRPPKWLFRRLLARVQPAAQGAPLYPNLHRVLRFLWLLRRAVDHLRFMDFNNLPGRIGYVLYGVGFIDLWHRFMSPRAARLRVGDKGRLEIS